MGDQRVVEVGRLGKAEQRLQQALRGRRGSQVLTSNDQIHTRCGIVHDAGQVIGGWRVLSCENGVAEIGLTALVVSAIMLDPAGQACDFDSLGGIEPPAVRRRCAPLRIVGQAPARAGILASGIAMRSCQRLGDLRARAETGVDQSQRFQLLKSVGIGVGTLRLDDRTSIMAKAQPFEILENACDELRPAAARIEVLDPEQEFPAAGPRERMAECRRVGVAQVEPSGR